MGKKNFILVLAALVLFSGFISGCDKRSQLEKDADAAAKKIEKSLN